jgi:hypothetical protein
MATNEVLIATSLRILLIVLESAILIGVGFTGIGWRVQWTGIVLVCWCLLH